VKFCYTTGKRAKDTYYFLKAALSNEALTTHTQKRDPGTKMVCKYKTIYVETKQAGDKL
jgi:hypothetical protein